MANGPGQPAQGPGRRADSLARYRWVTAAGLTVAAVAGGGVALVLHDSSAGPRQNCGLVPCAAALPASVLPASVQSGGTGPASAPATAAPTATQRASAPHSPAPSTPATAPEAAAPATARPVSGPVSPAAPGSRRAATPPGGILFRAPGASSAGQAVSTDRAVGVGYEITEDSQHGIHGQIVIANNGSAPVTGWRVTVVLPGATGYQVLGAGNRSAGDALVLAPAAGQAVAGGSTELIAFTARGATGTPVRVTFTDAASPRHAGRSGSGAAAGQETSTGGGRAASGRSGHDGGTGGWLSSSRPTGGWPNGGWPGQGGSSGGGTGGGSDGQHHGRPGGR